MGHCLSTHRATQSHNMPICSSAQIWQKHNQTDIGQCVRPFRNLYRDGYDFLGDFLPNPVYYLFPIVSDNSYLYKTTGPNALNFHP